jgi:galactokinase
MFESIIYFNRWGGCAVALTSADQVDAYIEALKLEFYASNLEASGKVFEHLVFQTEPQDGATVILAK